MRVEELTIEVRDENLNRVGQILPVDLVGFKAVLRFNNVGSWEIDLPVGHPMGELLRLPGYGIVVTGPDGVMLSGPTTSAENTKERGNPEGSWIITGADDSIILGERLAYPTPSTADVTAQTSPYDTVTNAKTSTAMYGYVTRNLIPGTAPTERAIANLTTAADTLLGTTVTKSARFNVLGELLTELAVVDGLGFDIKQQGYTLEFSVYQPVDRSLEIRMDIANNTLSKTSYGYASPGVTKAIVAGQGQAEDRTFVEVTTAQATSAQALWARRIENFIDQRNTDVAEELTQAGLERLAEAGNTITSVDVVPSSDTTMRPFVDWNLGDRVGVVIGGQEVAAVVTQIAITIESDGVRIGATVGEPTGVDYESLMAKRQQTTTRKVNALERKEGGGGGGGAAVIVADAKPTDAPENAVWFRSSDGSTFVNFNDGSSTQFVELKNPNNYTGDSAINAFSSRMTAVEGVTTTHTSQISTVTSQVNNIRAGYYVRQIVCQVDTADRTFGTGWTLMVTLDSLPVCKAGSKLHANYQLPLRNDSYSWGGAYIEPQISFNGGSSWWSLGSSGYDGSVMHESAADIATYSSTLFIDPAAAGVTTDFTPRFRFYAKTYEGSAYWNGNHDLGATSGTATRLSGNNGNQHYAKIVIEELATGQ